MRLAAYSLTPANQAEQGVHVSEDVAQPEDDTGTESDPEDSATDDGALGLNTDKEPDPNVEPEAHSERLRLEQLAAFERECFMSQSKLDVAREHQPWMVDQYATELANAERQFTDAGGELPAKAKVQKRKGQ